MNKIEQARNFAIHAHKSTNHKYDGKPYEVHLGMTVHYAEKFKSLITTDETDVLCAVWLHDTIEDCRITYNDLREKFGFRVAELVFAVTNDKGRTRKERASRSFYTAMNGVPDSAFVKICDRLANVKYSADNQSRMLGVYKKEAIYFQNMLAYARYHPMFTEMDILLQTR